LKFIYYLILNSYKEYLFSKPINISLFKALN